MVGTAPRIRLSTSADCWTEPLEPPSEGHVRGTVCGTKWSRPVVRGTTNENHSVSKVAGRGHVMPSSAIS